MTPQRSPLLAVLALVALALGGAWLAAGRGASTTTTTTTTTTTATATTATATVTASDAHERHEHSHSHARGERSARADGSARPPRDGGDPEIRAATESAKSANAARDPRENVPESAAVVTMLDDVIGRLETRIEAARAAGDSKTVERLEVRLSRLRRDRAQKLAQGVGGAGGAGAGGEGGAAGSP